MQMKSIKIDTAIKNKVSAPIPEYLIQQRQGGGNKMLSYLSGSTVTDMLNDAFGYAWSWEVKKHWIEESAPYFNAYSKSRDKVFHNGKEGAWEEQGSVAHVLGKLTVYLETETGGIVELSKDGYGSKSIMGKQNDQESIFKAAGTDALKKAASLFGIGLSLYRNECEQAYFDTINYVDPWEGVNMDDYKEFFEYIEDYKSTYGVDDNAFAEFVGQVTQTTYEVTPENIESIVTYIKDAISTQE
jgi:recombination DNA repair RAD52 pathway protein